MKQKMSAEERRRWYEQALNGGGSVLHGGRLITRFEDLPSLSALATTTEERTAALDDIAARRRELELEEARLRGLSEGLQQSTGTTPDGDELPQDFPGRDILIGSGYATTTAVASLSKEELLALNVDALAVEKALKARKSPARK
jgi:hypothetical protein